MCSKNYFWNSPLQDLYFNGDTAGRYELMMFESSHKDDLVFYNNQTRHDISRTVIDVCGTRPVKGEHNGFKVDKSLYTSSLLQSFYKNVLLHTLYIIA